MRKILIYSLAITVALISTSNYTTYAGWFGSDEKKEEKKEYTFPVDEKTFQEQTKEFHFKPQENPILEFNVFLPKDWIEKQFEAQEDYLSNDTSEYSTLDRDLPDEVAEFESPFIKGQKLQLKVQSVPLYHEISAKYWLERYLNIHEYLLSEDISEKNDKEASAAYTFMDGDTSKSVRIRAIINSNIIMLVTSSIPSNYEEALGFLQKRSLESFTITNIVNDPIEKKINLDLQGAIGIYYPSSWKIFNQNLEDPRYMLVQLQSLETTGDKFSKKEMKKINGVIEIAAIRRRESTNLMKEINNLKSRLEDSLNISFNKMIESKEIKASPRFTFSRYESYVAEMQNNETNNKEIHIAVLGDDKWYVIAFLYTPQKETDSYNWARNVQSFTATVRGIK